jgi:hypothetical protein
VQTTTKRNLSTTTKPKHPNDPLEIKVVSQSVTLSIAHIILSLSGTGLDLATLEADMVTVDLSRKNLREGEAIVIAAWLASKDRGGLLSKLNISDNMVATREAGKALSLILQTNSVLRTLDVSSNMENERRSSEGSAYQTDGAGFIEELAVGISLHGSGLPLDVNILGNDISAEQAQKLIQIINAKGSLQTLCGIGGRETRLDLSASNDTGGCKRLYAGCAVLLANEIVHCRSLTSLNLSGNLLFKNVKFIRGAVALADAILECQALSEFTFGNADSVTIHTSMTAADFSGNDLGPAGAVVLAAFVPKCR